MMLAVRFETSVRRAFLACFGIALGVRLLHLVAFSWLPFFYGPIVDALAYREDAQRLLGGGGVDSCFYRPPLYTYLRAALMGLSLGGPWPLGIAHAIASASVAGVVVWITATVAAEADPWLRKRAMWVAGLAAALWGPSIATELQMLPAVWVQLCCAGGICACLSRRPGPGAGDVLAGGLWGLSSLGFGPCLALAPAFGWLRVRNARRKWLTAGCLAMGLCAPLAWSTHHNATHGAPGVVLTCNLGINLWIGNNPRWRDTWRGRPGLAYDAIYNGPTRAGALTPTEREWFYLGAVWEHVRAQPVAALQRTARKLYHVAHGAEISRDLDLGLLRDSSPMLAALLWHGGVFFPFGLLIAAAALCPRHLLVRGGRGAFWTAASSYGLVLSVFFISSRYRLPLLLLLWPLAAVGSVQAWRGIVEARRKRSSTQGLRADATHSRAVVWARWGVAAVLLVGLNLPSVLAASFTASPAERMLQRARSYRNQGKLRRALELARSARARDPANPDAPLSHGELALQMGAPVLAERSFARATRLAPQLAAPRVWLARAQSVQRRYSAALRNLEEALRRNPHHRQALRDMATTQMRAADRGRAIQAFRRYLSDYEDDMAEFELARLLLAEGERLAAVEILGNLQRRHPGSERIRRLLEANADMQRQTIP